jgi:hypothetical protein
MTGGPAAPPGAVLYFSSTHMTPLDPQDGVTLTGLYGGTGSPAAPQMAPLGKIGSYRLIRKLGQKYA